MKNRSILLFIIVLFLALSFLSACGNTEPAESTETSLTSESTVALSTVKTTEPEAATEPAEITTESVTQASETSDEVPEKPTKEDIAAKLAERYLYAIIDRVIWGTEIDLDGFAASDEYKEQLEQFTDSLVMQHIRVIHLFDGDISKLRMSTDVGGFREENGVLVGNATILPTLLTENGETLTPGQTVRLRFAFEGENCKISDASRVVTDLPADIHMLEILDRTTFSEVNFVYGNSSMSPEEQTACDFVAAGIENIVLGKKNSLSALINGEDPDPENSVYAFWAVAGGYVGQSFSGSPDVKITAKEESAGPGYSCVGVLVESGIVIEAPGEMCSPTPADGFFRVTVEQDETGQWNVTNMTVVHGDYNIAIHAKIQKIYLASLEK